MTVQINMFELFWNKCCRHNYITDKFQEAMKKTYLISFLILTTIPFLSSAQLSETENKLDFVDTDKSRNIAPLDKIQTDFHLSLGSSYSSSPYYSGLQNYIHPSADIQFSSDFKLTTGVVFSNSMNGNNGLSSPLSSPTSPSGMVHIQGKYKLSDKFTIKGGGYKEFNQTGMNLQHPNSQLLQNHNNQAMQRFKNNYNRLMNNQGFSLNLHYQINENISIEGGFQYNEGNNYFMQNHFYRNPGFHNGFYDFNQKVGQGMAR